MDDLRVKFYSATDMASGWNLAEAEKILDKMDPNANVDDINDALELYNIKNYIDSKVYLLVWSDEKKQKYVDIAKTIIPRKLGIFCSKISDNNILSFVKKLHFQYDDDFWEMMANYNGYTKISSYKFKEILNMENVHLRSILKHSTLVKHYNDELAEEIKSSPYNAMLLISNFLEKHDSNWEPLYFPTALSKEDKTNLVKEYISCESPNLNALELLSHSQSSNDLYLTDMMIYEAKKRHSEEVSKFFAQSNGMKISVSVSMSPDIDETQVEFKDNELSATYSSHWIAENSDYPTLLNNFIYLYEYTDIYCRCTLVSKAKDLGIMENIFGMKGKKDYVIGISFNQINMLSLLQIVQYERFLEDNSIKLIEVFKWFFEEYLPTEFKTSGFELDIPSPNTTYLEKCKLLATSLDRILKQFCMYIENSNIDLELLSISSNPILFKDIKSFVTNKYIYPCDSKLKYVYNSMFSSQSALFWGKKTSTDYDSFYSFIEENDVSINEYDKHRELLEKLVEQKFLSINSQGYIKPSLKKLALVRELYNNEVLCYSYIKKYYAEEIDELKNNGQIEFGSTLFSVPEQKYLNYFLNRAEFSNGLDLRNKYVHGSHAPASAENEHTMNYYIFLRILAIIIIKINEEFCLKDEIEKVTDSKTADSQ